MTAAVATLGGNAMNDDRFQVWQFLPHDFYECVLRGATAQEAVETAKSYTTRPAAKLGVIRRVIITDDGDNIVFEWKNGEGVTFPSREEHVQ